jgi:hypothetical protein
MKRRTGSKMTRRGGGGRWRRNIIKERRKHRTPVVLSHPFFIKTQLFIPKDELLLVIWI